MRRSMSLLRWGALGMAAIQLAKLARHVWLLAESFQRSPFPAYFETLSWQAGLSRASLAGGMAAAGWWVTRQPKALLPWGVTGLLAVLLAASGAWLAHAVARGEARTFLMSLTALHQLGMAVWLKLRLTPPTGRLAGFIFVSAMLLVGLILLFYGEPPVS